MAAELGNRTVFSPTDANNNSATDPGWPEGTMQVKRLNDAGRAFQGAVTREWDSSHPVVTTTGTGAAFTATYTPALAALANGTGFNVIPHLDNTGACTFNPGVASKAIKVADGGSFRDPVAGEIGKNQIAWVFYNSTIDAFMLLNPVPQIRRERVFLKLDAASTLTQPACTYSIVSNVITVTKVAHGHRIGHRVYVSGTSGGFDAEEAIVTITSKTNDTFTGALTHANASGNGALGYYSMANQLNVHSVCSLDNATDSIYVNYSIDAPSIETQMFNGSANDSVLNSAVYSVSYMGDPTISSWRFQVASSATGVILASCRVAVSW